MKERVLMLITLMAVASFAFAQEEGPTLPEVIMSFGTSVLMLLAFGFHWVIDKLWKELPQWVWLMLAPGIMSALAWAASYVTAVNVPPEYAVFLGFVVDWIHDQIWWFQQKQAPTPPPTLR